MCGDCRRLGTACIPRRAPQIPRLRSRPRIGFQSRPEIELPDSQSPLASPPVDVDSPTDSEADPVGRRNSSRAYLDWVALLDDYHVGDSARRGHLNHSSALMYRDKSITSLFSPHVDSALQNFPAVDQAAISQWGPTEQHLVNHYVQIVARALVVVYDDRNPFLLEILPMAVDNLAVRHAMLTLSARHLCRSYPVFEDTLVNQRTLALHYLKLELQSEATSAAAFAATLLMCLFEVGHPSHQYQQDSGLISSLSQICQGNSPKWILHMCGAKALIDSSAAISHSGFLVDLFNHLCCMAMVTSAKVASILETTPQEPVLKTKHPLAIAEIHPFLGLAEDLYGCLRYINLLAAQRPQIVVPLDDIYIASKLIVANEYLENWTPPSSSGDKWYHIEAVAAAQAVRWGCVIWLQHLMFGYSAPVESRQQAIDEVLSAVSQIRPGSAVESQLIFPLFIAGVTATRKAERLRIEYRLSVLESTFGMGNVAGVQRVLDAVWKKSNEGHNIVEWEVLLQQEHSGVLLL